MTRIDADILVQAYAAGLFPMAENAADPVLHWIDPEERGVIPLAGFHVPHSVQKQVLRQNFEVRINTKFENVIAACAERTANRKVTWINRTIKKLYTELHNQGKCHSVECWQGGQLVGGLYGVHLGAAFFGESMFSRQPNASKVALVHLVARLNFGNFKLLDAQFMNDHLVQFGARPVARADYLIALELALRKSSDFFAFNADKDAECVLSYAKMKQPSV